MPNVVQMFKKEFLITGHSSRSKLSRVGELSDSSQSIYKAGKAWVALERILFISAPDLSTHDEK